MSFMLCIIRFPHDNLCYKHVCLRISPSQQTLYCTKSMPIINCLCVDGMTRKLKWLKGIYFIRVYSGLESSLTKKRKNNNIGTCHIQRSMNVAYLGTVIILRFFNSGLNNMNIIWHFKDLQRIVRVNESKRLTDLLVWLKPLP